MSADVEPFTAPNCEEHGSEHEFVTDYFTEFGLPRPDHLPHRERDDETIAFICRHCGAYDS